jgi:protease II
LKHYTAEGDSFLLYHPDEPVSILSVEQFAKFTLAFEEKNGIRGVSVLTPGGDLMSSHFPASSLEGYNPAFSGEYNPETISVYHDSFLHQRMKRRYSVATGGFLEEYAPPPPPVPLHGTILNAIAKDGTAIPITFLCKKDLPLQKPSPTVLVAYGAYGKPLTLEYPSLYAPLLQRNICLAFAHIRGGGYKGPRWHIAATGINKPLSISDLIAAAEFLIDNGYSKQGRLAASGRSAGALTIASAVEQRPELFAAVALEAPFLDTLDGTADAHGLSIRERSEWGDSQDPDVLRIMKSYNPMRLMGEKPYPAVFLTTSASDTVVPYWHALIWGTQLRTNTTSKRPVIVRIHRSGDHAGLQTAVDQLQEEGLMLAFLLKEIAG